MEADGRLAALAGVASGLTMVTFSSINPEIEASPRQVWATAKEVFQKIKELGYNNLYAVADPARPSAGKFLERLGFEHVETSAVGEVYLWKWH